MNIISVIIITVENVVRLKKYRRLTMKETKIMHFDFYVGDSFHNYETELRNRIKTREEDGWEVEEMKIIENKKHEDWYDIFLMLKRG